MSPSQWQSTKLETPPQFLGRKKPSLSRWFGEDTLKVGFLTRKVKLHHLHPFAKKAVLLPDLVGRITVSCKAPLAP